jgi:FdhD protein
MTLNDKRTEKRAVLRLTADGNGTLTERTEAELACEVSLAVHLNGEPLLSILCLDEHLEELATGFLFTEGIIDSHAEIVSLEMNELLYTIDIRLRKKLDMPTLDALRSMTSGCGRGITYIQPEKDEKLEILPDGHRMSASSIWQGMKEFSRKSELYLRIGGVHSAFLRHPDFSFFSEDIGRHNCVDKIAGMMLRRDLTASAGQAVLFISGRISSEIMTKLIRLRVPVIVSRSAPTAAAVRFAEGYNLTLLGYVRRGKAMLYAGADRIEL